MACKKRTWLPKICKKVVAHASCYQQQYNTTIANNNKDHKCYYNTSWRTLKV
jgi:hypothetical protein